MSRKDDIQHSILIVSSSEQFVMAVKSTLVGFVTIEVRRSAALARRTLLEREFELVVISEPLPDELGENLAMDVMEKSRSLVLLFVPREKYGDTLERVTDSGVLVIASPASRGLIDKGVRFLLATGKRLRKLEQRTRQAEEKLEETRLISQAKILLVEKRHMSEDDAHRYIGKLAMDEGMTRKYIAEQIIDDLE